MKVTSRESIKVLSSKRKHQDLRETHERPTFTPLSLAASPSRALGGRGVRVPIGTTASRPMNLILQERPGKHKAGTEKPILSHTD